MGGDYYTKKIKNLNVISHAIDCFTSTKNNQMFSFLRVCGLFGLCTACDGFSVCVCACVRACVRASGIDDCCRVEE